MKNLFIAMLAPLAIALNLSAELTLPTLFTDQMVLQRNQTVPVWGTAEPGSAVTVEFADQKKTVVTSDSATWRIDLDPMIASSTPRNLTLHSSSGNQQLKITKVLVGDVWLCSGQSNMQWPMARSIDSTNTIAAAAHPLIRLYKTPTKFAREPQEKIDSKWTACTPESVRNFSAVAYYFGKKLNAELDVPIGLLQSAWGGTRIEPWTPPSGFEGVEALADVREKIQHFPEEFGTDKNKVKHERQYPTAIYNGMIHAHIPFAIKGAIWYQGEANHREDAMRYVDLTAALLQGWRSLWEHDFPYYFVQIAPFQYGQEDPTVLAGFWEAQAAIVKEVPNTGMAVVSDATTLDNIHPPNKEVPGTRLALLALDNTYGKKIVSTGPTFKKMKKPGVGGNTLEIVFDSAKGLTTRDGEAPDWFEIVGEDGLWKPADTVIKGRSVILSSPDVEKPVAMRFAWHKLATPNLMNAAGLPAPAFRAGEPPNRNVPTGLSSPK